MILIVQDNSNTKRRLTKIDVKEVNLRVKSANNFWMPIYSAGWFICFFLFWCSFSPIRFHWPHWPILLTWINNHMPNKVWMKCSCIPKFQRLDRWSLRINILYILYITPHFVIHVITYPCRDSSWFLLVKGGPRGQPYRPCGNLTCNTYVHTSRDAYMHILYASSAIL